MTNVALGKLASTTGRWAAERLSFLGHRPYFEGSPTKLYLRADMTPEIVARVAGRASPGRAGSVAETKSIVERVGRDVGRALGLELRRTRSSFRDSSGATRVWTIAGRRERCCSSYVFRLNPGMRSGLETAENGWLAFVLVGADSYLLIPWSEAGSVVGAPDDRRQQIRVAVDAHGSVVDPELQRMQRWLSEFDAR